MRYNIVELNRRKLQSTRSATISKVLFNGGNHTNMPIISVAALSEDEIVLSMRRLKNKMTCGPDNIPSFLVKDCAYVLAQPLCMLFNLSLKQNTFPDVWKAASVCPILKNGDTSEVTNYRPIILLCNFAKVSRCLCIIASTSLLKISYLLTNTALWRNVQLIPI